MTNNNKQKLELTWIGKNNPEYDISNIEPRILEERSDLSYGDPNTENMIIHGDNLLALKALLPEYEGKIKCIYIDPPYNTGNAFEHYDDAVEHSIWLSLLKPRLELLRMLLKEDGSIWISIDNDESHYLKVLCDEVFGRSNVIANVVWQKRTSPDARLDLGDAHENILVYATDKTKLKLKKLAVSEKLKATYKNPDNDPRGPWVSSDYTAQGFRPNQMYEITTPGGKKYKPRDGGCWANVESVFKNLVAENRIWFGKDGNSMPRRKTFLSESVGSSAWTWWTNSEVGHNQEAKKEIIELFGVANAFQTPKPERLIHRVLSLGSDLGDIVLDSFLGSGTTIAVSHKMGRKYIGIEMGEHAYSHVHKRMKKVVDGTDGLKLSEILGWKGGSGFKFYELAPSFIIKDEFGNPVIDSFYNDTKLIKAMCKLMNFRYQPSQTEYWKHGIGQGKNYLYVTTQLLTSGMTQQIAGHLVEGESLIISPKKYEPGADKIDSRITIKKIPQSVLKACHFGKKEYLLPIKESAMEELEIEEDNE